MLCTKTQTDEPLLLFLPDINRNGDNRPAGDDAELVFVNQAIQKVQGANDNEEYKEKSFHKLNCGGYYPLIQLASHQECASFVGDQFMGRHFNMGDDFKAASKIQPMGVRIISQGDQTQGIKSLLSSLFPG